ncbi:MAG TPA: hypothetical protein VME24_05075 [Alphaproteobacteria bacterium]|nr:hypothetical protein [Alphaproteobacteria bacterium]
MTGHKYFDKALDSVLYYQHSTIWLCVSTFVLVGGIGGFMVVIGPKIPLSVSVPIAAVMWPILLLYAWKNLA